MDGLKLAAVDIFSSGRICALPGPTFDRTNPAGNQKGQMGQGKIRGQRIFNLRFQEECASLDRIKMMVPHQAADCGSCQYWYDQVVVVQRRQRKLSDLPPGRNQKID